MALLVESLDQEQEEYETIGRAIDGEVSSERLYLMYAPEVWESQSDEWFEAHINGPYTFAIPVTEDEVEPIEDPVDPDEYER